MAPEERWSEELAAALVELAGELPGVSVGKMFGYPALYAGGKLAACAYGQGVALKLPGELADQLLSEEGFEPFRPYGKATMRGWVLATFAGRGELRARVELLETAAAFVSGAGGARRPARPRSPSRKR